MGFEIKEYEKRMRAVKRCVISHSPANTGFDKVLISSDIAEEIAKNPYMHDKDFEDSTWEGVPLRVDENLPTCSVVYISK